MVLLVAHFFNEWPGQLDVLLAIVVNFHEYSRVLVIESVLEIVEASSLVFLIKNVVFSLHDYA